MHPQSDYVEYWMPIDPVITSAMLFYTAVRPDSYPIATGLIDYVLFDRAFYDPPAVLS